MLVDNCQNGVSVRSGYYGNCSRNCQRYVRFVTSLISYRPVPSQMTNAFLFHKLLPIVKLPDPPPKQKKMSPSNPHKTQPNQSDKNHSNSTAFNFLRLSSIQNYEEHPIPEVEKIHHQHDFWFVVVKYKYSTLLTMLNRNRKKTQHLIRLWNWPPPQSYTLYK